MSTDIMDLIIHTDHGDKRIDDITVFDNVYNYATGYKIPIRGIKDFDKENMYKVIFSDNREGYFRESEMVFISGSIIPFQSLLESTKRFEKTQDNYDYLKFYPNLSLIYTNKNSIELTIYPDPYTAGALLVYGNQDIDYINLPIDMPNSIPFIVNKYRIEGAGIDDGRALFKWHNAKDVDLITWDNLFSQINGFERGSYIIPHRYIYTSEFNRWEFIRGIFDTGGVVDSRSLSVYIFHKSREMLIQIQRMLWGLGILSNIFYDPIDGNESYRLELYCHRTNLPNFFYDIIKKEKAILMNKYKNRDILSYKINIKSIEHVGQLFSKGLILGSTNMIYLTNDFIPKLSV